MGKRHSSTTFETARAAWLDDARFRRMSPVTDGLDPDLGPGSPATIEGRGSFGSEAMRARMWSLTERHGRELLDRARAILVTQAAALECFARMLDAAGSLSGDRLLEALREAGVTEAPAMEAA